MQQQTGIACPAGTGSSTQHATTAARSSNTPASKGVDQSVVTAGTPLLERSLNKPQVQRSSQMCILEMDSRLVVPATLESYFHADICLGGVCTGIVNPLEACCMA